MVGLGSVVCQVWLSQRRLLKGEKGCMEERNLEKALDRELLMVRLPETALSQPPRTRQ
jgi:hypothetical protein